MPSSNGASRTGPGAARPPAPEASCCPAPKKPSRSASSSGTAPSPASRATITATARVTCQAPWQMTSSVSQISSWRRTYEHAGAAIGTCDGPAPSSAAAECAVSRSSTAEPPRAPGAGPGWSCGTPSSAHGPMLSTSPSSWDGDLVRMVTAASAVVPSKRAREREMRSLNT